MEKPSEATVAKNWKSSAERALTITLPSGNVVKARRPSLFTMMNKGILPDHLYQMAMAVQDGKNKSPAEMDPKELKAYFDFFMIYVVEAVVEPKVIMKGTPGEGYVHVEDFSDEDMFAVFKGVNAIPKSPKDQEREEESAKLEPFRKEQASGDCSPSSEGVLDPSLVTPGD